MYLLLSLILLPFSTLSSHLNSLGVELNYNNAGYATEFHLIFSFTTPYSSSDYLKAIFPFALHSSSINSIPDKLSGYFTINQAGFHCGDSYKGPIKIYVDNALENSYYIQLLNPQNQPISLSLGTFYTLILQTDKTNANIQSSGVKAPIQLFSVSDMSSNAIIYDSNTVFGTVALNDYPSDEIELNLTNNNPQKNAINAIYNITLDIFPQKTISDGARFQMSFLQDNIGFSFTGGCFSIARTSSTPLIPQLDPSIYNCSLDDNKNLVLSVGKTIQSSSGISLNITIMNPGFVAANCSLEVRSMLKNINTIIEINQTKSIFYTNPLNFTSLKLFLSFGLDLSKNSLYPFSLPIIRGDSLNPTYYPYNTIRFKLKVSQATPTNTQLILLLSSPPNTMLLPGSISHNLPSVTSNKAARCYVPDLISSIELKIVCDNIGALFIDKEYFLGCRMYFPYDQWTQPLRGEFGTIYINSFIRSNIAIDPYPLFFPTKAISQIQTSNNPSWFIKTAGTAYDTTIVSTEDPTTATPTPPETGILGLETSTINKRLVFSMNMIISDVYTPTPVVIPPSPTPAANIPFGAGLIIMTSPSVSWDGTSTIAIEPKGVPTAGSTLVSFDKYDVYNKISITSTHTSQLLSMFAYDTSIVAPPDNFFSLTNLRIVNQTSLYADDDILDFYIASFEQINTAYPAFRKVLLYNAYTIRTTWASQIRFGIVNYWSTSTENNVGDSFPTFIRLAGYFEEADLTGFTGKFAIFFNDMNPFYLYPNTSQSDEISCFSNVIGAKCMFYPCNSAANGQSYHNLNRVEIDFLSIFYGISSSFEILIPVSTVSNAKTFDLFLGFLSPNPRYTIGTYYKLLGVYRLTGGSHLQTNQISLSYGSTLGNSWGTSITSRTYGLTVTGLKVGDIDVDLSFSAGHNDGSNLILVNTGLNNPNNAAGFTISSSWNFITSNSIISFSLQDANSDNVCLAGYYISKWTLTIPTYRYTIFCPYTTGIDNTITKLTIIKGKVPYIDGDKLPSDTSFVWSNNDGNLKSYETNVANVIPSHSDLVYISVQPPPRKGIKQNYLQWTFLPKNPFLSGFVIKVVFTSIPQFYLSTGNGLKCQLRYANGTEITMNCVATLVTTLLSYTITGCLSCPLDTQPLQINHWGIINPDTDSVDIGFYLKIYSPAGNLIETSGLNSFSFNNSNEENSILLSNLKFSSLNKRSRGPIQFTLYMNGREIWNNEYLVVNLGGIAKDNAFNIPNIRCKMLENDLTVSKSWFSIDLTDLTAIGITPKTNINVSNSSFTFYCDGVITPYSYNPAYLTIYLEIQGTSNIIKYGEALNIDDDRFLDQYLFDSISAILVNKHYNSPGSILDLTFNFTCANQQIEMSSANFILDFPVYYSPALSNGLLLCEINGIVASCTVNETRRLLFQYIPTIIPINTQFQVRVYGVDCPYEFIDGYSFYFGILPNSTSLNYSQYGYIADIAPASLPLNIQIFSLKISNEYIRSYSTYTFKVNFPAGSISSSRIITLDFPIEWDLIINYNSPSCQIYNPDLSLQFVTNCSSYVNKLVIYLGSSDITSNFYYILVLNKVRNPDYVSCDMQPFILSVLDLDFQLVSRSHINQINKNITEFLQNPDEINLAFEEIRSGAVVEVFEADIGVFNKFIRVVPDYGIFVETISLTTSDANFGLYPSTVSCKFGAKYCEFAIAAVKGTLPGLYNLEVLKTENFEYHTRLPFLKIRVSQKIYSFQLESSTYDLPIGGTTLPIKIFFTGIVPQQELKIDTKFNVGLQGISFINQSSLLITPDAPIAILLIQSDAAKTVQGTDTISLIKSGSNSESYTSLSSITLNIFQSTASSTIVLTIAIINILPITINLQITCDQTATFYYLLAVNQSLWRTTNFIRTQALLLLNYNSTDPYQEQFGFINMIEEQGTLATQLELLNLLPNMTYNLTGYCRSPLGTLSNIESLFFQAGGNGGKLYKVISNYSISMSTGLISSLGCFFNKLYKIPTQNIKTIDNASCLNRRLLQTTTNSTNDTNTTNNSNYTNNTNNINDTSNMSTKNEFYSYNLYFYPNDDLNSDINSNILMNSQYTESTLKNWILNNITGIPNILNISQPIEIDRTPPIVNTSYITINATMNNINLNNVTIGQTGFLYLTIEPIKGNLSFFFNNLTNNETLFKLLPNNTRNQSLISYLNEYYLKNLSYITCPQIRNSFTSELLTNVFPAKRFIFNSSYDVLENISFTGLTNGTFYMISMYATGEDPSYFAPNSQIYKWIQNTTAIQRLALIGGKMVLVVVMWVGMIFLILMA